MASRSCLGRLMDRQRFFRWESYSTRSIFGGQVSEKSQALCTASYFDSFALLHNSTCLSCLTREVYCILRYEIRRRPHIVGIGMAAKEEWCGGCRTRC